MGSKVSIDRLRVIIGCHLRNITSYILFLLIAFGKSKPLAVSHKSALIFSPHQDDETLGCGGAIALKRQMGVPVKVIFLTDGRYGIPHLIDRPEQVIEKLVWLLQDFIPEEVYVPHHRDFHDDHEATYKLVQEAIALAGVKVDLWQYPIWLLWQNPLSFELKSKDIAGAYRLAINSVQAQKHQAIEAYKSQIPGLTRGFLKRFFSPQEIYFKD
jgi:LmbE family N-acetylglucosaminyl deacetylase